MSLQNENLEECTIENTSAFTLRGKAKCKVLQILDGDTFRAAMYLGGTPYVFRFRVLEINAPELKPRLKVSDRLQVIRKAKAARLALEGMIMGRTCDVNMHGMDNFGRLLAEVYVDEKNVGHEMIETGNAVPFYPNHHKYNQTSEKPLLVPQPVDQSKSTLTPTTVAARSIL
jgi:endonuclease YncB( thermonuclease family)